MANHGYNNRYRVSIDDVDIPEHLIVRGSYKYVKEPVLLDSYRDATGTLHEIYSKDKKAKISFKFREFDSDSIYYWLIMSIVDTVKAYVEYYDITSAYYTNAFFKIKTSGTSIRNIVGEKIKYNEITVELEEY